MLLGCPPRSSEVGQKRRPSLGGADVFLPPSLHVFLPPSLLNLACFKTTDQADPLLSLSHGPKMNLARKPINEKHDLNLERL